MMTTGSLQDPAPELDQIRAKTQQILDTLRQLVATGDTDSALIQRGMLELLAARALRSRRDVSLDEALDLLTRELDVSCLLLLPENQALRDELEKVPTQLKLDIQSAEQSLTIIELFRPDDRARQGQTAILCPPDWLVSSLASLAIPDEPLLCLDCGDSTLVPRLLLNQAQSGNSGIEFAAVDRKPEVVDNLRLMISMIVEDLEQVREAVVSDEEWVDDSPQLFDTSWSSLGSREFGTIVVNLLSPVYSRPRHRSGLNQLLPTLLAQRLMRDGRALFLGSSILLDGYSWEGFRADTQKQLHVEAIVELASDGPGFEDVAPIPLALVTLRKPQQAITRSVTVFAPRSPHDPALTPDDLLDNLVLRLEAEEEDRPLQREIVFERPTSELLADRWNPKFYCPARLSLQDELISDPQVTWLGGVAQFIARGSHPSLFEAYIETRVAGVTFEDRQETITHLKIGDQVRLRREVDHPHDPNAVHVERRSGASVGYLPTELAAEVAEAMDDLGGEHWATVTRTQGGTQDRPTRGVTIRFAPPQHARIGEPVPMIRPSDITNNRLAGKGELVWLLHEHQEKVTRLQAGDILLFLRGFQKVCVVSREFEGAVCHRDFAIVRPNEDIDSFYLLSFILSPEFQQQLQFIARGGPLPIVNLKDLEELLVIVPPMATQRRIALAFAESQGQLGAGHREGVGRWIDLVQGDTAAERQLIYSTLLSNLFSDWDQTHTLDDWLRLKGDFVRDLRNSVAHGRSSFGSDAIDISIIALGDLNRAIEQARDPGGPVTAVPHVQQLLAEFRDRARQVDHSFLRSRLSNLASRLAELLQTESVPLPFQLSLEQAVLPAGLPALLRLSVVSESREALSELEIVPRLSSGEIIERPAWRLEWLDSGEAHAFEARVQVPKPEVVRIECAVSYTREDGEPVRRATQLMVEVVPADQVPFIPIQPNPYITGGAVDTPEMFFGRQDVLDFLSTNLIGAHQSNVIILQGNRRTGKSSILKQVVNRDLFAPHIPVFVDCQGLGALTDQRLFYKLAREIWKALAKRSDIDVPPQVKRADISEDDPFYDFQEVLDGLVAQIPDLRIILLIDEFELLDQAIQENKLSAIVLENLRHLFQHRHDLAVVLTGSYRLTLLRQEYWSILFGLGLTHKVGFLDEGAARQLVTQPLAGIVTYSEQAVDRMIELTACHPYFVQVICHNMVNVLNMERSTYVTPSNVEVAAQETLTSAGGHMRFMFDSAGSKVRQAALVYLASSLSQPGTLPSHEIEGFVESHRLPISRAELEQALRELADRDIVGIQGTMGQRRYGFKIDLVRQWIRRNYDLHSAIALAQDASYVGEG